MRKKLFTFLLALATSVGIMQAQSYADANFAINFQSDLYTIASGSLPEGTEVTGTFNDNQHGYYNAAITIPVTAGNYKVTLGACGYGSGEGAVTNEDGSVSYASFNQKLEENDRCYHQSPANNIVVIIFNVPADQKIVVDCGNYTPYFAIEKIVVPAFTDFEINFQSDPYSMISGAKPEGTVIAGSFNDAQHGYQNVEATVPMEAGTYRLTLGVCRFGNGAGNVMSETNVELASFNQKLDDSKCYDQNPAEYIVSVNFTVDIDQNITIDCGQYTPYMKLEKITEYTVGFALGDAEGSAPVAVNVTIGDALAMPANRTMYKAGYTLTGWSDGVNTYAIGADFTPTSDIVLTPVFTANAEDALQGKTVRWYFGTDNGAPEMHLEGGSGTGFLIAQADPTGTPVDVKLYIDATSGKFKNTELGDARWAQVNAGTVMTFFSEEGAIVRVWAMNEPTESTLDGNTKSAWESNIATYAAAPAAGISTYTVIGSATWYGYLEVTYPTPAPTFVVLSTNVDPNDAGVYYTTFFDGSINYALPNDGTEAYAAEVSGDAMYLHKIAENNDVLPANTAVLFKAPSNSITLTASDDTPVTITETNHLLGVDVVTATPPNCYVLSGTPEHGVGFYPYSAANLNAHKAYITYGSAGAPPRRMRFVFDGAHNPTALDEAAGEKAQSLKVVENGQLIIIKNGVRYNAQGKVVK